MFIGKRKGFVDTRQYKRAELHLLVKFKVEGTPAFSEQQIASLTDIGGGGVRLRVPTEAKNGMHVALQINFPPRERPINAEGEIIHLQSTENPRINSAGVKFSKIDEEDRTYIIKRVNALTEEKPGAVKAFFKSLFRK